MVNNSDYFVDKEDKTNYLWWINKSGENVFIKTILKFGFMKKPPSPLFYSVNRGGPNVHAVFGQQILLTLSRSECQVEF